jgi:hypothetical protein
MKLFPFLTGLLGAGAAYTKLYYTQLSIWLDRKQLKEHKEASILDFACDEY